MIYSIKNKPSLVTIWRYCASSSFHSFCFPSYLFILAQQNYRQVRENQRLPHYSCPWNATGRLNSKGGEKIRLPNMHAQGKPLAGTLQYI
jgi:hypothetical protein